MGRDGKNVNHDIKRISWFHMSSEKKNEKMQHLVVNAAN